MFTRFIGMGLALGLMVAGASTAAPLPKIDATAEAKIRKLQVERRDVLKKALTAREQEYEAGRGTLASALDVSKSLLKAELDLATKPEQRLAAHAAHLKIVKKVDEITAARYEAGQVREADYYEARAARLKAEIGWLKAGGKEKKE